MKNGNLILIGFMGSGKSTLGRYLNKTKNRGFLDTDEYIEKEQQRSISDIFATDGEEAFRDMETKLIKKLLIDNYRDTVFGLGGGMPIREENGELLKQLGTVVYLRATVDTLVGRLSGDDKRPLLKGGDLREKIENLMAKRAAIYEKRADLIIDTDDLELDDVYERICEYENSCN